MQSKKRVAPSKQLPVGIPRNMSSDGDGFYETWAADASDRLNVVSVQQVRPNKKNAPDVALDSGVPRDRGPTSQPSQCRCPRPRARSRMCQLNPNFDSASLFQRCRSGTDAVHAIRRRVKIAKELGWTSFDDDELYSPENSIALAAQYLADLNAMFPNQTGGRCRFVQRW